MFDIKDFTGRFCVINNRIADAEALKAFSLASSSICYEVIRVVDGIFLFLEDHLNRLEISVNKSNNLYHIDYEYIKETLLKLQINNKLMAGNVRLLFSFSLAEKSPPLITAYPIFHHYPDKEETLAGIKTSVIMMERESPNIKLIHANQQDKCREAIISRRVYEVLLVDQHGFVTEGSKSNLFLVREGSVFTPPGDRVLRGITREKVIAICHEQKIPLSEESIPASRLPSFDAAFITGTSPKVLPIATVDAAAYDAKHPLIGRIKAHYDTLIENYITMVKQIGYGLQQSKEPR